jgi:ribonuclease Z
MIREKDKLRRIDKQVVKEHKLSVEEIKEIKMGGDLRLPDGRIVPHDEITSAPYPSRSYAYCSDTCYLSSTAGYVRGVDLLYHESTFDNSQEELAQKSLHSTAEQAAMVAREAGVGTLLLGHYSARFTELKRLLKEAKKVFPKSKLSKEGKTYTIGYR